MANIKVLEASFMPEWGLIGSSLSSALSLPLTGNGTDGVAFHHSIITTRTPSVWNSKIVSEPSVQSLAVCFLFLLPVITYVATTLSFRKALAEEPSPTLRTTPTIPYMLPFLCHIFPLAWNPAKFFCETIKPYWRHPLNIYAGTQHLTVVTNPAHAQTVFRSSKHLSSKPGTLFALRHLLDAPAEALHHYETDDSGMAATPRRGCTTTAHKDRIHYHQASAVQKYLSGTHLASLSRRYMATLSRNLADGTGPAAVPLDGSWVEHPDLYAFLQAQVSRSAIESLMGSEILAMHPRLVEDFWEFDRNVPRFMRCLPRWVMPGAYRARDRLLGSVRAWHERAARESDWRRVGSEDPEWEPWWGSKLLRRRQEYMVDAGWMDGRARASEDVGMMFASNGNVLPAIFWFIFEALKDPSLCSSLLDEVQPFVAPETGDIDIMKLASQPLLQSTYAETLRLRIAIGVTRVCEQADFNLDGYRVKKDRTLLVLSRPAALNEEAWTLAGRKPTVPLEEFQADRFLVKIKTAEAASEGKMEFSMDGLAGCWMPYGGGQRMCPGRHFAKNEMLGTFALLFTQYEIELGAGVDTAKVQPDLRWFPVGGLPPVCRVPFRIRRRVSC